MRTLLTAALLATALLAGAEDKGVDVSTAPGVVKAERPRRPDQDLGPQKQQAAANASESAELKSLLDDLHARQMAAITAVNRDSDKTPEQKRAALRSIHEDFRLKRAALRAQAKADGGPAERPAVDAANGGRPADKTAGLAKAAGQRP